MPSNNQEYYAFISYKREDERWAKWLQHKLEYYKLPVSMRRNNPQLKDGIRPIFKDTTDLELGILADKIRTALDNSQYLIVICSPRSANSTWVSKEVNTFTDNGRADKIIPFIIGGVPNADNPADECFPEGLRQMAGEREILGANINEMGREAAAIKVVARMFNLHFDTLWQRYERDSKRKQLASIAVALIAILIAIGIGLLYADRNKAYDYLSKSNAKLEAAYNELSLSKDSIIQGNKELSLAYDSITKGNRRLQLVNDSLDATTHALMLSNEQLSNERNNLRKANNRIITSYAEQVCRDVEQLIENSRYVDALDTMRDLLTTYQTNNLYEVDCVERVLRELYDHYNYWNNLMNYQTDLPIYNTTYTHGSFDIFDRKAEQLYRTDRNKVYTFDIPTQHFNLTAEASENEVFFVGKTPSNEFISISKDSLIRTYKNGIVTNATKIPTMDINGINLLDDSNIIIALNRDNILIDQSVSTNMDFNKRHLYGISNFTKPNAHIDLYFDNIRDVYIDNNAFFVLTNDSIVSYSISDFSQIGSFCLDDSTLTPSISLYSYNSATQHFAGITSSSPQKLLLVDLSTSQYKLYNISRIPTSIVIGGFPLETICMGYDDLVDINYIYNNYYCPLNHTGSCPTS